MSNTKMVIYYCRDGLGLPLLAAVHHCHPSWCPTEATQEVHRWLARNEPESTVACLKLYGRYEDVAVGVMTFTAPSPVVESTLKGLASSFGNNSVLPVLIPVKGPDYLQVPERLEKAWREVGKTVQKGRAELRNRIRSLI